MSITLSGTIDPNATGLLTNTATVSPPAGVTDTNPADNTSTDTDTLTPQVDLGIIGAVDPFNPGATWDIIA